MADELEHLWDGLLSRQEDQVWEAYRSLDAKEQEVVIAHLMRMANETGWHPEQRRSAQVTLRILSNPPII